MKNLLVVLLVLTGIQFSHGQSDTKKNELSNAERFSSKSGTLIEKKFGKIGTLKEVDIKVVRYKDLMTGEEIQALLLEHEVASSYSTDTKRASLDSDEIQGLIKSIKMMEEKVFNTSPAGYTEVTYKSRTGFEAGCFSKKGDWSTYLKLEKYDGKSYVFLKKDDFPELLAMLERAYSAMK